MRGRSRLGVDLGGTWIRAALLIPQKSLRRMRYRLPPGESPEDSVRRLLRGLRRRRVDVLTIGARACWRPAARRKLRRALRPLARSVRVISDLELSHRAALGGLPGVVVISGTGAAALGIAGSRRRKAGGLAPPGGDPGSAYWIGSQWLAIAGGRTPKSVSGVAALAPKVLRRAARDARARKLVMEAAVRLAALALSAGRGLGIRGQIPLSWQGGLFADEKLRRRFLRRIGRRFAPQEPLMAPELCAALWDFC